MIWFSSLELKGVELGWQLELILNVSSNFDDSMILYLQTNVKSQV